MTKNNRGRHQKGAQSGKPAIVSQFKFDRQDLIDDWEAMTNARRADWGYNFESYIKARKK